MAPSKPAAPPYNKDEKVLCFHHEMLYEAKIIEIEQTGEGGYRYKVHYKGWKATWDDWVPQDRIRKLNDENRELASQLNQQARASLQKSSKQTGKKINLKNGSDFSSARGSEERTGAAVPMTGRSRKRDFELEHEDAFHNRPSIKLVMPDLLKAILVDDWEHVTKDQQLVPLPHKYPVDQILKDYLDDEKAKREEGSTQMDILEETIAGLREYFDRALGRILLYRFERLQLAEKRAEWEANANAEKPEGPSTTYGAEHLCRLLVSLPELVGQTNMDQQSVSRLREEITKFSNWLSKNSEKYFVRQYEDPGSEYIEKARNA
ncbi:Chromatin modification-related protein eaf3 [Cytospora mali]|uniref:Chromatin modification-related protein EAF3 n=1 Tax=Cytospora mali TaxID=578113 RepID=A0A194VE86_CYTMA|nr:Chromatin modification-related protein eaf3 [Valsa mali var. pyri (nom. inval.)]